MDDRDVERILSRYQPLAPPADLRARALASHQPVRRTWPWVAAAAALLATTVGFHAASARLREPMTVGPGERAFARERLALAFGGDDLARARAEILLAAQDIFRQRQPLSFTTPLPEDPR